MTLMQIEDLVLGAMRNVNLAKKPEAQLEVAVTAPIFGAGSRLDSLGLVALLIDIEEALQDRGYDVSLSDARAMSETHSPFRSVPALVAYIDQTIKRTL